MTKTLSTLEEGTIPEETMLKHEPVHKVVIYADHNGCKVHPPHLLVEPNETIVVKALKTDIQVFLPEGGPFDFDPALIGERVIRLPWEPRGVVVSIKAALRAAEKLQSMGYSRVQVFMGGFRAWDDAGYPADISK